MANEEKARKGRRSMAAIIDLGNEGKVTDGEMKKAQEGIEMGRRKASIERKRRAS